MAKDTIQESIGKFIYNERKKQNLSMAKLSMKAHGTSIHATRIGNIEKGLIKNCSINTLDVILKALGFDLAETFKPSKK
jgi:transcriptional regulator with XRE-family HTH domain